MLKVALLPHRNAPLLELAPVPASVLHDAVRPLGKVHEIVGVVAGVSKVQEDGISVALVVAPAVV